MKEYQTVAIPTQQGIMSSKGTADTATLDAALNKMAKQGWHLVCIESLQHQVGTASLLCVFSREVRG